MKLPNIDTLVPDIQRLFINGAVLTDRAVSIFSEAVASNFKDKFDGYSKPRTPDLYLSNVGKPLRQLWFEIKGTHKREQLSAATKLKFLYGDILEEVLLLLCIEAGHDVSDVQRKVEVDGVRGRIDCIIDEYVVDFKSCSTFSFNKFKTGTLREDDPFGYVGQLSSYYHSLTPLAGAAFLAVDKTLGHICLLKLSPEEMEQYNVRSRIVQARDVLGHDKPPEDKCYEPIPEGKSGNLKLGIGCSYCNHKFECWKDANDGNGLRTFLYYQGPTYFTKIERTPNVKEVDNTQDGENSRN